jgi:hypothetical protein
LRGCVLGGRQPLGNFRQSLGGTVTAIVDKCQPAGVLAIVFMGEIRCTRNIRAISGSFSR